MGNVFGDVLVDELKKMFGLAVCTLMNGFVLASRVFSSSFSSSKNRRRRLL